NAIYICWNLGIPLFDKHIQKKYILPLIQEGNIPFVIFNPSNKRHKHMIQAIEMSYETYNKKGNGYELIMTMQYLSCLNALLPEIGLHSNNHHPIYDQRVKTILEYIHNHFREQIKLESLSKIVHLSNAETIRIFKRHVERTPFKYIDRKSTRLNSSHVSISYAVFCLKKK